MYEYEISLIKRDLGIEDVEIHIEFVDEEYLSDKDNVLCTPGAYGGIFLNVHSCGVVGISGILVCTKNKTYQTRVQAIAHEYRHAQQYLNGNDVYVIEDYVVKARIFNGVYFPVDMPYMERPWEKDAFAYQYDVWRRLFAQEIIHEFSFRNNFSYGVDLGFMYKIQV